MTDDPHTDIPAHELPELNPTALAMAYGAAIIETLHPGFLDGWVKLAENKKVQTEIRRLREPPASPELTATLEETERLVRHIRLVALANMERGRRKKR